MNKVYKVIQWQACVTFHEKERMNTRQDQIPIRWSLEQLRTTLRPCNLRNSPTFARVNFRTSMKTDFFILLLSGIQISFILNLCNHCMSVFWGQSSCFFSFQVTDGGNFAGDVLNGLHSAASSPPVLNLSDELLHNKEMSIWNETFGKLGKE